MRLAAALLLASLPLVSSTASVAHAEPTTLRLASAVPDGTAWARELRAFGREVAASTQNEVEVKWYLSGIAGDELQNHDRVQRDQLDGVVSGGMLCQQLAPTLRAAAMAAQFHDADEAHYVMARLRTTVDDEVAKAGYVSLGLAGMGFSVIFSKKPLRTMDDLKQLHPWLWNLDEMLRSHLSAMGLHVVPLPIDGSARAYDDGKVDGFVGVPAAALAFQWSAQARYVIDLRVGYLAGCMLMSRRAWEGLTHEVQQQISSAAAKLQVRIEDVTRRNNELLLGGLFARQGLQALPVPAALQADFDAAAHATQKQAAKLAPTGAVDRVAGFIAEYRSRRGLKR